MLGLLNLIPCKRALVSTTNFLWNSYYPLVKSFLHEFPGMGPCYISLNCSTLVGDWQTCRDVFHLLSPPVVIFPYFAKFIPPFLVVHVGCYMAKLSFSRYRTNSPTFSHLCHCCYCVHFWAYRKALLLLIRNFLRNSWANWFFPIGTFRAQICRAASKLFFLIDTFRAHICRTMRNLIPENC